MKSRKMKKILKAEIGLPPSVEQGMEKAFEQIRRETAAAEAEKRTVKKTGKDAWNRAGGGAGPALVRGDGSRGGGLLLEPPKWRKNFRRIKSSRIC